MRPPFRVAVLPILIRDLHAPTVDISTCIEAATFTARVPRGALICINEGSAADRYATKGSRVRTTTFLQALLERGLAARPNP